MVNLDQFKEIGKFLMLALDHRGSFKKCLNSDNPDSVKDEQIIQLKSEIIASLKDQFSGLLIDVDYGLSAYQTKTKPYLLSVEKSGYIDKGGERITELEYSVKELIDFGAAGAKLLLYFNPKLPSAKEQLKRAKEVLKECKEHNFPFFLEIVTYEVDGPENRTELVLNSLKTFLSQEIVPDVFKLEYPGSFRSCTEVTALLLKTPWIILTRGDSFDTFVGELKDAIRGGAVGFLAGRALWQEVCKLTGGGRQEFLSKTLPDRFRVMVEITTEAVDK